MGALLPTPPGINALYQRSQYGADFGGPIVADKLFFFMDGEWTIQHTNAPLPVSAPFSQYSGTFSDPFHGGTLLGRVDDQWIRDVHLFYRFACFKNSLDETFGSGYSVYDTKNITRDHVVGVGFKTGNFVHSIRRTLGQCPGFVRCRCTAEAVGSIFVSSLRGGTGSSSDQSRGLDKVTGSEFFANFRSHVSAQNLDGP